MKPVGDKLLVTGRIKITVFTMILTLISYNSAATVNTADLDITGTFNVPVPFINSGNLFVIGSASIIGDLLDAPSIHFGISELRVVNPTNFVASDNIGGIPLFEVHSGSSFSSAFLVSGISDKLLIEQNAAATFSKALSVSGVVENDGTLSFANNTLLTIASMENNGSLNIANSFTIPNTFASAGNIYVTGNGAIFGDLESAPSLNIGTDSLGNISANNFEVHGAIVNVPIINIGMGSSLVVDLFADFNYSGTITGAGKIVNNGVFNTTAAIIIDVNEIDNNGSLNIAENFTVPAIFTNTGHVYAFGSNAAINGAITGGQSLNFGKNSQGDTAAVAMTLADDIADIDAINILSGNINTGSSNAFTNIGSMTVAAGAVADFAASYAGTSIVNNAGNLYIGNAFAASIINNNNGGELHIENTANTINSHITNADGANLYARSDIVMPGKNLINQGVVHIYGNLSLSSNQYVSTGGNVFSIHSGTNYDSLDANCEVNLNDGYVVVDSVFLGEGDQDYSWTILQATQISTNDNTLLAIPFSTMLRQWDSEVTNEAITIMFRRTAFTTALQTDNDIPTALDDLANSTTHGAHHLLRAVSSCNNVGECNTNLERLKPAINSGAKYATIQNAALNKTEMRISAVREQTVAMSGIAFGEHHPQNSAWSSGFGSLANQKTTSSIAGYNAKAAGALLGFDKLLCSSVIGGAIGWSNSNINEGTSSDITTKIIGYHALLYGSVNIAKHNFFEWLVTAVSNTNHGDRIVNISGTNFDVSSDYHSWQGGFRFNLGQNVNFDHLRYSLLATLRYTALQQPGYDETGSPAALHVAGQGMGNILTVGAGIRASALNHNRWLANSRELRAMVTYDAVTTDNVTAANFIIGGSDFTISNSASRLALQLGASYGFAIANHLQLQFSYDFELRNEYTDNTGEIKLRYLF